MEEEGAAAAVVDTLAAAAAIGDWPLASEAAWALELMAGMSRRLTAAIGCVGPCEAALGHAAGAGHTCHWSGLLLHARRPCPRRTPMPCCPAGRRAAWRLRWPCCGRRGSSSRHPKSFHGMRMRQRQQTQRYMR